MTLNYAFLSTWKMSFQGIGEASRLVGERPLRDCICAAVRAVEDDPAFRSVGYGALPNLEGEVELDAAYMDGDTMRFGGIIAVRDIANPIDVAASLSTRKLNCLLSGQGAEDYARANSFPFRDMLTEASREAWSNADRGPGAAEGIEAYDGHDTVCVLGKRGDSMAAGVSTSGLFLKQRGRVGDSPVIGSGFYCDSAIGAAAATGVGEDVMRGCLSFAIVRLIEEGYSPQGACQQALDALLRRLARTGIKPGGISLIALGADGAMGAVTNLEEFAFVYADQDNAPAIWIASAGPNGTQVEKVSAERLAGYRND